MAVGATMNVGDLWARNSVELRLPATRDLRTQGIPLLSNILRILAEVFRPRWGWVLASLQFAEFPDVPSMQWGEPHVGWLTYLSQELGTIREISASHGVEQVPPLGAILIARPQPWDVNDPDHRASIQSLQRELEARGFVHPDASLGPPAHDR